MFRLDLPGGFGLEGPSVGEGSPRARPRQETLLASCSSFGCRREGLVAFRWPERREGRSRRSLPAATPQGHLGVPKAPDMAVLHGTGLSAVAPGRWSSEPPLGSQNVVFWRPIRSRLGWVP